ncbi:LysE family transporter [Arthrobacter gandavensis]|uniref:LysE family transporter n=1 Tax=Arthrobacter gandavensis TaxID=169960 RepID=UPI00188DEFA6|nr:LysE family transporter [Arthrobacter gandavensis]MBF4994559.1 LysE family transporter [Arthrobacter gandavensis]
MEIFLAVAAGAAAGFGLAAPLGAVAVLLLREGLAAGFRRAAPAAAAVALVDAGYCALAVTAGSAAAPVIASWGPAPSAAGGLALMALGLGGLLRARPGDSARHDPAAASRSRRRFALFMALTAANPVTLLYFTALATGLSGLVAAPGAAAAFVAGTGAASGAWQLGLVLAGATLKGRVTPAVQRGLSRAGNCTVAVLGAAALAAALS